MHKIGRFDSAEEAHLFKMFLGSRGIESTVDNDNLAQMLWNTRSTTGAVQIVLDDPADALEAEQALVEYVQALNASPREGAEVKRWPAIALIAWAVIGPLLLLGHRAAGRNKRL